MKSINKSFIPVFITFVLTLLPLLNVMAQIKEDTVAKVNGEPVYLSEVENMKENLMQQYTSYSIPQPDSRDLFKMALDRVIEEKLLYQQAARENIKVFDSEIKNEIDMLKKRVALSEGVTDNSAAKIEAIFTEKLKSQNMSADQLKENIRKKILIEKFVDQKIKPLIKKPSDDEIRSLFNSIITLSKNSSALSFSSEEEKEFYLNLADRINEAFGERVRYRQIVIKPLSYTDADRKKAEEKAKQIKQRILNNEDFEEIAIRESADPVSSKNGGDMGYVFRGNLPPSLEKVVFSLNVGEISDPVWTDYGCHIIQVTEKKMAEKPKFEKLKMDLENIILQKRMSEEIDKYIKKLKESASIEIYNK